MKKNETNICHTNKHTQTHPEDREGKSSKNRMKSKTKERRRIIHKKYSLI